MTNSRATPCVKGNGDGLINSFNVGCLSDAMGNAATRFEWDAENRLTAAYSAFPQAGDKKVTFKYDYLNRRVEKNVYDWTGSAWSATPSQVRRFVYAGHLLLMEVDGGNNIVRKYSWGLDLAGQAGGRGSAEPGAGLPEALEAAGGIGGLLAVYDLNDTPGAGQTGDDLQYVYTYDGNGNVVQVLDWSASSATAAIVAKYEYDPYGNVVAQAGDYAERNPFRFSTKQWDAETGFGYWEQRYYSPRLGRWLSRDPAGERGDDDLYRYALNQPTRTIDALGLCTLGDACYDVELGVMPGFQADPSERTLILIVLATVETVQTVSRVQDAAQSYGASECVPSLSPGMFKLSVNVSGLLLKLRQQQIVSIWTRHRCSTCSQGLWNSIFSGLGICKPKGSWRQDDWTAWNKCKELINGWIDPDAALRGLPPEQLKAYANRCVAAEQSRAASSCGASRPCGAPPKCEKCGDVTFEYEPY